MDGGWDNSNQGGAPPSDNSWNQGSSDNNSWNQGSSERERSPRRDWNNQGDNNDNGGSWNNNWNKDDNNSGGDWKKDDGNSGGDWKNNDSGGSWSKKDWGGGGGWNKDDKWGNKEDNREICRFFAKAGWCKSGDDCKYKHIEGGGSKQGKQMAGDWACPSCGFDNFAKNRKCKKCGTDRPGLTAEEGQADDEETKKKDKLVKAIKKYQRIDDDNTENWYWFCDVNRFRDKYDPGRKPIEFLEDFVTAMKVPEWEENGDSGKGGKGKGGGGGLSSAPTLNLPPGTPDMASLLSSPTMDLSSMMTMMQNMQKAMGGMSMPAGMPAIPGGMPLLPGALPGALPGLPGGLPGMPTMPGTMPAGMPALPFMPS